jgi:hypothetical protein
MPSAVTLSVSCVVVVALVAAAPAAVPPAQSQAGASAAPAAPRPWPDAKALAERKRDAENRRLFRSEEILPFTLTGDFRAVDRDRDPASTKTYPATISFQQPDGTTVSRPVRIRGRGHSRRSPKLCDFTPLRIEFTREQMTGTVFAGHDWIKLGTHCRSAAVFEQYVLRELSAYRVFNVLTPHSFRARLARATYVEAATQKPIATRFALFLEDDDDVARRMEGRITEQRYFRFRHVDMEYLTLMTLFEYMIGNTDVSIYSQHNIRLVETPAGKRYPVPYDFDYSGLVNTSYATFDKTLFRIQSVRDRVYRGPCRSAAELEPFFERFREARARIMAIYDDRPEFTDNSRRDAKSYLEGFYRTIDNPAAAKRAFIDGCVKEDMM